MAFGDLEPEEPCLYGIGQVVERILDQKWYWAKILGPGSAEETVNLEYLDDHKVEEDVPLSEVRVSTVPGAQQHLRGARSTSGSKPSSGSELVVGIGSAGDDGAPSYAEKAPLFVADAAGGLEHSAYVEQALSAGGRAREVATQTADEENQTYLFAKRTTLEPRKPFAVEAPVIIPIDEMEGMTSRTSAVATADASACTDEGGDDAESGPSVPASGPCAFPGCGKESTYRCARCGASFYCGRVHQKQHWSDGHAGSCQSSDWLARVTAAKLKAQMQLGDQGGGTMTGSQGSGWPYSYVDNNNNNNNNNNTATSAPSCSTESQALILLPQQDSSSSWFTPLTDTSSGEAGGGPTGAGDGYVSDLDEEEEGGRSGPPSAKRAALQPVAEDEVLDFQQQQHMSVDSRPPTPIGGGGSSSPPVVTKKEVTWSQDATIKERSRKRRYKQQHHNLPETGYFSLEHMSLSGSSSDPSASHPTDTQGGGWAGGGAAASLSRRPVSDENIVTLLEMGFGEQQSRAALQMYNDDVERACELLLSGAATDLSFLEGQNGQVYGPQLPSSSSSDEYCRSLFDDDMKTQAGDLDMLPLEEEEMDTCKFASEANIRVGSRGESHPVTVDVYGLNHPQDLEPQRPYALRFIFKDREGPQVMDVPGRDVVVGVNTYKKDRDLLLPENEDQLIRTILNEISAASEGDRWTYSLMFPGRMVARSRPYVCGP